MKHRKTQEEKRVAAPVHLERQLGLKDVYALATGATLSSGFFLLPGLAAAAFLSPRSGNPGARST